MRLSLRLDGITLFEVALFEADGCDHEEVRELIGTTEVPFGFTPADEGWQEEDE